MSLGEVNYHDEALSILSALSLRSSLRNLIISNDGIKVFTEIIEGSHTDFANNVKAHRVAAKGLMNLALSKREIRHQIISELSQTLQNIVEGRCD